MVAKTSRYGAKILQRFGGHHPPHAIRDSLDSAPPLLLPPNALPSGATLLRLIHQIEGTKLKSEDGLEIVV
jgi:hypothetical protein